MLDCDDNPRCSVFDILVLCYNADMYPGADLPASVVLRRWVGDVTSSVTGIVPYVHREREASKEAGSQCVGDILPFCIGKDVLCVVEFPTYLGGI